MRKLYFLADDLFTYNLLNNTENECDNWPEANTSFLRTLFLSFHIFVI